MRNRLVKWSTEKKSGVQWMLMILFPVQHFWLVINEALDLECKTGILMYQ